MSVRINIKYGVTEKTNKPEYVTSIVTVLWGQGQKYRSSIADKPKIFSLPQTLDQV